MNALQTGQVITLKIRYNNQGDTAERAHPYLIVGIDEEMGIIEIAQLDSLKGKEFKAARRTNKTIFCDDPAETVIDRDSYIQLDNSFRLENHQGLLRFRRQEDKLSCEKLEDVLSAYRAYHEMNEIDEDKIVYMDANEIRRLNS